MTRVDDTVNLKREAVIFRLINVGISLFWRAGITLWPTGAFYTALPYMTVILSILALNFYRAFAVPKLRVLYAAIAVLNVLATVGIGNTGFLTSVWSIYLIVGSRI